MFSAMFSLTSKGNSKPGAMATRTALADLSSGELAVVISFSSSLPSRWTFTVTSVPTGRAGSCR